MHSSSSADIFRGLMTASALLVGVTLTLSAPMQQPDYSLADRFPDREFERDLAILLQNALSDRTTLGYVGGSPCAPGITRTANKRNSEIINSLLGLPKSMNDVGR